MKLFHCTKSRGALSRGSIKSVPKAAGLIILVLLLSLRPQSSAALDYDATGVWFCGSRDVDFVDLVNIGSKCNDSMAAYVPNPLTHGFMTTRTPEQACMFYGGGGNCYKSDTSRCQLSFEYLGDHGVQCSPYLLCPDKDKDGFACCPDSNCYSAKPNQVPSTCKNQDCPWSKESDSLGCSDNDRLIFPGSKPINSQLVSIRAELHPDEIEDYKEEYKANLTQPTVLDPLKVTVVTRYCQSAVDSFDAQLSAIVGTGATEKEVARASAHFKLVSTDGKGLASYELEILNGNRNGENKLLEYPTDENDQKYGENILETLIGDIARGEVVKLAVVVPNDPTLTEFTFPPYAQGLKEVIPYTNCKPLYGSGKSINFTVRFDASLYEGGSSPPGSGKQLVYEISSAAEIFFKTPPHQLLIDKITWSVDLNLTRLGELSLSTSGGLRGSISGDQSGTSDIGSSLRLGNSCIDSTHVILMHNFKKFPRAYADKTSHVLLNLPNQSFSREGYPYELWELALLHEIGHMFSSLADEYLLPPSLAPIPPPGSDYATASDARKSALALYLQPNCTLRPDSDFSWREQAFHHPGCTFPEFYRPSPTGLMKGDFLVPLHNIVGCSNTLAKAYGGAPESFYEQCASMPGIVDDLGN